ncbi:hypothetical protein Tdes44962_MAKER10364, partial [Teratosphaeria destructans]
IDDRGGGIARHAVVELGVEAVEAVGVLGVVGGGGGSEVGVPFDESETAAAADLVEAVGEGVLLDVRGGVHGDDDVGGAGGVEQDIGRAVVVHAGVDEVDARAVFQTGGSGCAGLGGGE